MKLIKRPQYLDQLKQLVGTPDIKVITGIRRSGKSQLLADFEKYLKKEFGEKANIIHLDLSLQENEKLLEYHALHEYIEGKYQRSKQNFVLVDEVQMCENFEKTFNSLHAKAKYDIYITGSNAFLLSSDLATLFTGRTYDISIFPFSFQEYLKYYGRTDVEEALTDYLTEGGMAGSYVYDGAEQKRNYLASIYDTLILRDIIQRYKIKNEQLLNNLSDFLMDNVSNITSVRSIAKALSSKDGEENDRTVGAYLDYLCEAFAFYKVKRYDVRGKKYLASQDKYYLSDHSFRAAKLGTRSADQGRILENVVAMELMRRGYEIYVGQLRNKEVDFVAMRASEQFYIQVSNDISLPETFAREIAPLLDIRDAYPKMILTNSHQPMYTQEGVKIVDVARWLAGDES